jgi:hypothetical protein
MKHDKKAPPGPCPQEVENLRQAFGRNWITHPEAVAMRKKWWRHVEQPDGSLQLVPIEPEREGAPAGLRPRKRDWLSTRGHSFNPTTKSAQPPLVIACVVCAGPVPEQRNGRRKTCSPKCRQKAYRQRQKAALR